MGLAVSTMAYAPYALFNYLMPIMVVVLAAFGLTFANSEGKRLKPGFRKKIASEGA